MNRFIDWSRADWGQTDEVIAARLGCKATAVKKRREKLKQDGICKKKEFSCTAPSITLRLEDDVYNAVEFLGILAGDFEKPVYITDVVKALIVQGVRNFGETYYEEREPLEHFLSSETACKAKETFWRMRSHSENLKAEREQARNTAVWGLHFEERLKKIGMDCEHRDAYRRLARIKRASNTKPYVFRLQSVPVKGYGRIEVSVYAPAKGWDSRCELAFEAKEKKGLPLVLGLDLVEDEDILRGLPKESSPKDLFHRIFRDWDTVSALHPAVDDARIKEEACEPEAYQLYSLLKKQR